MTKLETLISVLKDAPGRIFLQPHNVPDPDALAASFGLRHLLAHFGVSATIVYDYEIEKANALKMIELFGIELSPAAEIPDIVETDWAVLVDVQKNNSNLTDLPTDEIAAIDHHESQGDYEYLFADIRPRVGSCSAIVAEYFHENNVQIPSAVATALLYGIYMDTAGLSRAVAPLDLEMFYMLYPQAAAHHIVELQGHQISLADLKLFADAFNTVQVFDELAFIRLSDDNDSLLGTAADIVTGVSGVNLVVAYAERKNGIKLSTRSISKKYHANKLVQVITEGIGVGGGHQHMAGGFIPQAQLADSRPFDLLIKHRALTYYESIRAV